MDLFDWKARAKFIKDIKDLKLERATLTRENTWLTHSLRQMDQEVFNMSQQPSWDRMQPFFVKLCEMANVRMKQEHERIGQILIPELNRTYGK